MKIPSEMRFATFADEAKACGALNRLPGIDGDGVDVLSYTVCMNGAVIGALPAESLNQAFEDDRIQKLTEKVGLDTNSLRDKLKVAELVAVRNAWMSAVLDATTDVSGGGLSSGVLDDYESLTDSLDHPWVVAQVEAQKSLKENLVPVHKAASAAVGRAVTDTIPEEITRGMIVAQNTDFTVQAGQEGVVTHENRRLASVPSVGDDVTVLYYRGNGQVFANNQALTVSEPFVDPQSGDLAVQLAADGKTERKMVLFNGLATFAKFVELHALDTFLVEKAITAREAAPKKVPLGKVPEGVKTVSAGRWVGNVLAVENGWAIQDTGRGALVAHDVNQLGQVPKANSKIDVQYGKDGKAMLIEAKAAGLEKGGR